jgi:hypothetical protein
VEDSVEAEIEGRKYQLLAIIYTRKLLLVLKRQFELPRFILIFAAIERPVSTSSCLSACFIRRDYPRG